MKPDLVVGDSGDGKTTLLGTAALYLYKQLKKPSLLISAETGGWGPVDPLVSAGIIEVVDVNEILGAHPYTFEVLSRVCRGFRREGGKWVLPDLSKYAGFLVEGLTAFSEAGLLAIALKAADAGKGENFGPDAAVRFVDGELSMGSNGLAHYNLVQNEMLKLVNYTARLPGKVIWTAREAKETDEGSGQLVYGPELAGRKKTASAPAWFGHCLSIELRNVKVGGVTQQERVLHTQKWFDPGKTVPHLAKTRATPLDVFVRDHNIKGVERVKLPPEMPASLEVFYTQYEEQVTQSTLVIKDYLGGIK